MIRASLASLALAASVAASTPAHAFPHFGGLHRHPAVSSQQDTRVEVRIFNTGVVRRDFVVGGHVYTLASHEVMSIKAPVGTEVFAGSNGNMHRKGDLLFAVSPQMQDTTIRIN